MNKNTPIILQKNSDKYIEIAKNYVKCSDLKDFHKAIENECKSICLTAKNLVSLSEIAQKYKEINFIVECKTEEIKAWLNTINIVSFCVCDEVSDEFIKEILELKVKHVGINSRNKNEANDTATKLKEILFSEKKETEISYFVDEIEVMKMPYKGDNGHIAIETSNMMRAVNHFKSQGLKFDEDSARYIDGKLFTIYFDIEIGGFAYHLIAKK